MDSRDRNGDQDVPFDGQRNGLNRPGSSSQSPHDQNSAQDAGFQKSNQKKLQNDLKFMEGFDPTTSTRNRQKKKKRPVDCDNCDCLVPTCPGCHYPCKSCGDPRCGQVCRRKRNWVYVSVETEGKTEELVNPHADPSVFGSG